MTLSRWLGGSGDWTDAAKWSGRVPDLPTANAEIDAAGTYTVDIAAADSVTAATIVVGDLGATLQVDGALYLTGALSLGAGALDVTGSGVIHGGTLVLGGGSTSFASGTLDGVKVVGPLELPTSFTWLTVTHGLTVASSGAGRGRIDLTGDFGVLDFKGAQTFDNAVINLGSHVAPYDGDLIVNTGILTLGPRATVVSASDEASATIDGATVVNEGAILASARDGLFTIGAADFVNKGLISVRGLDDTFLASGGHFANGASGAIEVGAGASAILGGPHSAFDNQGSILIDKGGLLTLRGDYTQAEIGAIDNLGALDLDGTLMNAGGVLRLGLGAFAGKLLVTGAIVGGTVVASPAAGVAWEGTLQGVTFDGPLNVGGANATVVASDGLTVTGASGTGPGLILDTGADSTLIFDGDQTLDDATIVLGHSPGSGVYGDFIRLRLPAKTSSTLTLGANVSILSDVAGANVGIDEEYGEGLVGSVVNDGSIRAASAGGRFTIDPDSFINSGQITVANGDTMVISPLLNFTNLGSIAVGSSATLLMDAGGASTYGNGGHIAIAAGGTLDVTGAYTAVSLGGVRDEGTFVIDGQLDNRDATVRIGAGALFGGRTVLGPDGQIDGGTLVLGGGAMVWDNGDLSDVAVEGAMNLSAASARVFFLGGVTLSGADGVGVGRIDLTGVGAILDFIGSQSLDNVTINVGALGATDAIQLFTVEVEPHTLTFNAGVSIVATAANSTVTLDDSYPSPDTLVSDGVILAGASGGRFTVGIPTFVSNGAVTVEDGDTFVVSGLLTGTGDVAVGGGGLLEVVGVAANQTIRFLDGAGNLALGDPLDFKALVQGFQAGDRIDLVDTAADALTLTAGDLLVVSDGSTVVARIRLDGAYSPGAFTLATDGHGGTVISDSHTVAGSARRTVGAGPNLQRFVASLANFGASVGAYVTHAHEDEPRTPLQLASPTVRLA